METLNKTLEQARISYGYEAIRVDYYFYLFYNVIDDGYDGFNFALLNIIGDLVDEQLYFDPSKEVMDIISHGTYRHDGLSDIHFTTYSSDLSTDILLETFKHLKRLESLYCPNV